MEHTVPLWLLTARALPLQGLMLAVKRSLVGGRQTLLSTRLRDRVDQGSSDDAPSFAAIALHGLVQFYAALDLDGALQRLQ